MGQVIQGAAAFAKILENSQTLFDKIWEIEVSKTPLDTPEMRAGLKMRLLNLAATIQHQEVRAQYRKMFMDRFDATFFARRPTIARQTAQVVDMKSFMARQRISGDDMALLTKLSCVEDDLAEATQLLGKNFSERGFQYQQDLMRMKADILRQIVESAENEPATHHKGSSDGQ